MKFHLPLLTFVYLVASSSLIAQDSSTDTTEAAVSNQFWEANLPGGSYIVSLSRISFVSMHSYTVKGAMVHEVTIETTGAALTRIYTMEAFGENNDSNLTKNLISRGRELSSEAGNKVGFDPNTTVHKEYPLTTHSKTIEYRLSDKADLEQLYKSLSKAWRSNKGRKITIK